MVMTHNNNKDDYKDDNTMNMLWLTLAIGMTTLLKAARYSASPIGGFRPPEKAMLTLKPYPSPSPTC